MQAMVMARGELSSARNPSATVLTRIKDARTGSGLSANWCSGVTDVEAFIASSNIDENAATVLQGCAQHVQQAVMHRGEVASARNPSATVLGRIKAAGGPRSGQPNVHQAQSFQPVGMVNAQS